MVYHDHICAKDVAPMMTWYLNYLHCLIALDKLNCAWQVHFFFTSDFVDLCALDWVILVHVLDIFCSIEKDNVKK